MLLLFFFAILLLVSRTKFLIISINFEQNKQAKKQKKIWKKEQNNEIQKERYHPSSQFSEEISSRSFSAIFRRKINVLPMQHILKYISMSCSVEQQLN